MQWNLGWKTIVGGIILAAAEALKLSQSGADLNTIIMAVIGILLATIGVRHAIAKSGVKALVIGLLGLSLIAGPTFADEKEVAGFEIAPYAHFEGSRLQGPDEWSLGLAVGLVGEKPPFAMSVEYLVHDVWAEEGLDAYPQDATASLGVWLFKRVDLWGYEIDPYGGLRFAHPTGPRSGWSPGLEVGVEAESGDWYGGLFNRWEDVLTAPELELFSWDATFGIRGGRHF